MKGVLIFDDRSDLAFYSLDKGMEKFVLDRIHGLDMAAGSDEGEVPVRDVRDCLTTFCLPFFTSFDVLQSLRKPVFSISVEDGFLIVFRKFEEHVYLALSQEEGDTEEILAKRLFVFNRIITLLYGPVHNKLTGSDVEERAAVWKRLSSLFRTYETLYLTDQVYLIEALEHVQFGQLANASSVIQKLAREVMEPGNNGGLTGVRHVMIMANTKLLTTYGRSPRLETADILLLTLLVYHHYHQEPELELELDGSEEPPNGSASGDEQAPTLEFQTPCSTPGIPGRSLDPDYESIEDIDSATCPVEIPPELPPPRLKSPSIKKKLRGNSTGAAGRSFPGRMFMKALSSVIKKSSQSDYSFPQDTQPENKFFETTVFLQPQKDIFVPHTLYCYQVYDNLVLVMIAECAGALATAGTICQTLTHINTVFGGSKIGSSQHPTGLYDLLEDAIRRLKDDVRREAGSITSQSILEGLRTQTGAAVKAWSNLKSYGFREYIEKRPSERTSGADWQKSLTRMDACATDLKERLIKLFSVLYLSDKEKDYNVMNVIGKLARIFSNVTKDYGEFLSLKGEVNIPMVSYAMQYPGMVHFIYIDRSFDDVMAPSLPTTGSAGIPYVEKAAEAAGETGSVFLRRKIWTMVQRVQRFLAHGYTVQTWLDNEFLYVYYLWINIPNNPLGAPIRFYSLSNVSGGDYSQPGVIGSTFYADVHNLKEGYMYELYAMFEAKMSIKEASDHCRSLAEQLWPNSRESVAPFSLIN